MARDGYRIVFLMNGWASAAGGIQTFNRELACAVANARPDVECIVVGPTFTESEQADALSRGVTLISEVAGRDWKAILLSKKLDVIPKEKVAAVVGHSYFSGEEAILLRERYFPEALGIHFIHMSPLHTESLKEYRNTNYVAEREAKVQKEISYALKAGLIFCVGPRLHRYMHDLLGPKGVDTGIIAEIDCGLSQPPSRSCRKPIQPKLLCLGRTDSVGVKGIDIFAYAAGLLTDAWLQHPATKNRPPPEFVVRGTQEEPEKFEEHLSKLAQQAGRKARFLVRPYTSNRDELASDFRGSSIFVMPSREEGFGLVACEALSLGVPILVSAESGFAEVICRVVNETYMRTDQCVITMEGELPVVARRYADAALEILMEEDRLRSYFQILYEQLLPVCSWEAGAHQFLETLARFVPGIDGDTAVRSNGASVSDRNSTVEERQVKSPARGPNVQVAFMAPTQPAAIPEVRVKWAGDFSSAKGGMVAGRKTERARLTEFANASNVSVVAVTALGGQGKTALVRAWIEDDAPAGLERSFDGVFAFSFYRGHSQEEFARELTTFLDPAQPLAHDASTPTGLDDMLRNKRILLFLDGLEVIQIEERKHDEGRLAKGPVLNLLRALCLGAPCDSLALITSRLRLAGFEDHDGTSLAFFELAGLTPEAGGQLLRDLGMILGTSAKREEYSRDLFGHPLMLRVFADAVKRRAVALDFGNAAEKVAEAMGLAEPAEFKDKLKRVIASYRSQLGVLEQTIVEAVAVFGGVATIDLIRNYLRQRNLARPGVEGDLIAKPIRELVDAGILTLREVDGMQVYSCHPSLQEGFAPNPTGARSAATISLYSRPAPPRPASLSEAEPYLRAIRIHTAAGAFNEAFQLLDRHLSLGDVFDEFYGGYREILECLLNFIGPKRRELCEKVLGRGVVASLVPRVVMMAMQVEEWEVAEEYAGWDAELLAIAVKEPDLVNLSARWMIANEIGEPDDARVLHDHMVTIASPETRGPLILERAELERVLGRPRAALALIRQWFEMDQPAKSWIGGWGQALQTLQYAVKLSHPNLASRCLAARMAWTETQPLPSPQIGSYFAYEELSLTPRAARTEDDWRRQLELAKLLGQQAQDFGARALGSWPIAHTEALNGLGQANDAERAAQLAISQFHPRSWRRLWFRVELARAHMLQGRIPFGADEAMRVMNDARRRQALLLARDAAELIVGFGPLGCAPSCVAEAQHLLDVLASRLNLADSDIPDLGPLPAEAGWDARLSQRILRDVRPGQHDAPASEEELDKALVVAAEMGASAALLDLRRLGASPRAKTAEGLSALAQAAKNGHEKAVETLLARAEPFDLQDEDDLGAAVAAVEAGEERVLHRLLNACETQRPDKLSELLAVATRQGSGAIIRQLCDAGADPSRLQADQHPLVRAARNGNLDAVAELAERIGDINKGADGDGETALMAAMGIGHEPVIAWLIDRNANIDARDKSGRSAADYAIQRGQLGSLDLLKSMTGRDALAAIEPGTMAMIAAGNGNVEMLQRAIARGAKMDDATKRLDHTPLVVAALAGHLEVIRAICGPTIGLDVNTSGTSGWTALMAAAEAGEDRIVTALFEEFDAKLDLADNSDADAITHALVGNRPDTIRLLAGLGARPRDVDSTVAAIRRAAAEGHRDALVAFLAAVKEAGWMERLSERVDP